MLSIPDWSVHALRRRPRPSPASPPRSTLYNRINREETARAGARYVDVTPQTRAAGADPAFLADDGLHPSGRTYTEWATLALPVALEALGAEDRR